MSASSTRNSDAAVAAVEAAGLHVLELTKDVRPCGCTITIVKYIHPELPGNFMLPEVSAVDECATCASLPRAK
jgi:hypothetical protein